MGPTWWHHRARLPKVVLLANPGGGRGRVRRRLGALRALADRHALRLELPNGPRELEARARRAVEDGVDRVVVAGGDGTVHWAIQGLAESATALAVLPLGSGNDFAASVGIPARVDAAMAVAIQAPARAIDLVLVRAGDTRRWVGGVAYLGLDSEVNRVANQMRWPVLGALAPRGPLLYLVAMARVLPSFRSLGVRLEAGADRFEGPVMFVAIANAPRYGGGMRVAPSARLDDGLLDVVIVAAIGKLELLRVFPGVFRGRHVAHRAVRLLRAGRVRVEPDRPLVAHGDGEAIAPPGPGGLEFEARRAALRVVAGRLA
jgi:diacylglycerol kinase (ATP)